MERLISSLSLTNSSIALIYSKSYFRMNTFANRIIYYPHVKLCRAKAERCFEEYYFMNIQSVSQMIKK